MADSWRLLYNDAADVADVLAMPSAVAEGKLAGRYIMAAKATPETIIIQKIVKRGILAGAEVSIDREEAEKQGIDVVMQSRAGRASSRPAETISLQEMMLKSSDEFQAVEREDDDLAALIYTSGTTGMPKGVMLTHGNFRAECEITGTVIKTEPHDRFASLVPFFHVFGLADVCVLSMYRGLTSVLVPQYHPRKFLKLMVDEKISVVLAIPTQYQHLMLAAKRRMASMEKKPQLKYCISGAAPLSIDVIDSFKEIFGATIIEGYGMTESTSAVAVNPPERIKPGSIGQPLPGIEMKVVDEKGNDLPQDTTGEIVMSGAVVSKGYFNRPEDTAETFENGWLHTGDIGYIDTDGYFFITDRKKDIIIKGGYNISPKEIEDHLAQHPKIQEAAVVGIKKEDEREDSKAFVVLEKGESVEVEEILEHCRKTLAAYKTPDEIAFLDVLPKSATGKLLRKELRGDYRDLRLIERE